jgi:uncharacterized protein (TIGR02246 family)
MSTKGAIVGLAAALGLASVFSSHAIGSGGFDRAQRTEAVRQVELAFAATVAADDREAFASFLDEDAVFVGSSGATVGREAIVEAWSGFFGPGRPEFSWRPEIVELSGDGTLALTRGPWTYRGKDREGQVVEQAGLFNSIWRRQEDGSWKVVFDAGCSPCPACPE